MKSIPIYKHNHIFGKRPYKYIIPLPEYLLGYLRALQFSIRLKATIIYFRGHYIVFSNSFKIELFFGKLQQLINTRD